MTSFCKSCQETKPLDQFPKSNKCKCKSCFAIYNAKYHKTLTKEQKEYYKSQKLIKYYETYIPKVTKPKRKKTVVNVVSQYIIKTAADKARDILNNRKNPKATIDREIYISNNLWAIDYRQFLYYYGISGTWNDKEWEIPPQSSQNAPQSV